MFGHLKNNTCCIGILIFQYTVQGFPNVNLPPVCPNEPVPHSPYCLEHANLARQLNQPVEKSHIRAIRREITADEMSTLLSTPGGNSVGLSIWIHSFALIKVPPRHF